MKERRYKMWMMNGQSYMIDDEDLKKLNDNAGEMLVRLKQVMVHPSSITAIEPVFIDYIKKIATRPASATSMSIATEEVPPPRIPDLFKEELLKLS